MPYLNDDDLASLHKTIDNAEKELNETKKELDEVNSELETMNSSAEEHEEDLKELKKSRIIQNVLLSLLAGIAFAFAYYFYNNGGSNIDVKEIKELEATRVIDSINSLANNTNTLNTDNDYVSVDESINSIKNNISGEKIYSVQIGAFAKNSHTLLSESLAGISSNQEFFKYSIGLFETLSEAQDFRRELVKIGFDDAFVASYIDGVRKEIENPN